MTIHGSCLCGSVHFQFEYPVGPFEICHCNRCRKLSGSFGMPALTVLSDGYKMTQGKEFVSQYQAPLLYEPPAYHAFFCSRCGSPLPEQNPAGDRLEIPAGLLDDDPGLRPDKHIFVEFLPEWDEIVDELPKYDLQRLTLERYGKVLPKDFRIRSHNDREGET